MQSQSAGEARLQSQNREMVSGEDFQVRILTGFSPSFLSAKRNLRDLLRNIYEPTLETDLGPPMCGRKSRNGNLDIVQAERILKSVY